MLLKTREVRFFCLPICQAACKKVSVAECSLVRFSSDRNNGFTSLVALFPLPLIVAHTRRGGRPSINIGYSSKTSHCCHPRIGLVQGRVDPDPTLTLTLLGSGSGSIFGDPAQGQGRNFLTRPGPTLADPAGSYQVLPWLTIITANHHK
jgi:hypothetical protein